MPAIAQIRVAALAGKAEAHLLRLIGVERAPAALTFSDRHVAIPGDLLIPCLHAQASLLVDTISCTRCSSEKS
jgi:hypothetical protein